MATGGAAIKALGLGGITPGRARPRGMEDPKEQMDINFLSI